LFSRKTHAQQAFHSLWQVYATPLKSSNAVDDSILLSGAIKKPAV